MSVTLPHTPSKWANVRICAMPSWGGTWQRLPMKSEGEIGFTVSKWTRACLPDTGTAVFKLETGKINNFPIFPIVPGLPYGSPDLKNWEIRIQVQLSSGSWRTEWWGKCMATRELTHPGSSIKSGDLEFHCVDGFARTSRWYLDFHQLYWASTGKMGLRHPGYNAILGRGDRESSNADIMNVGFASHTWSGLGSTWTDRQAFEHAALCSVPGVAEAALAYSSIPVRIASVNMVRSFYPTFPLYGSMEWLSASNIWKVSENESLREFAIRVFERGRGRGLVFVDWTDDTSGDGALIPALAPRLTIRPPVRQTITVNLPSGGTTTFPGSDTVGTTVSVDVIGDHRLGMDAKRTFQVTSAYDITYSGVEVRGEHIEVLAGISKKDVSLEGRWLAAELADLVAADARKRELNEAKFDHVYRRIGIPTTWDLMLGDGAGGTRTRCDYRCGDNGQILIPTILGDTSTLMISIGDRLPMYYGTDYSVNPPATFHGDPPGDVQRVPVAAWLRVNDSPERYVNGGHRLGLTISRALQDLEVKSSEDQGGRYRRIGDKTVAGLGSTYNLDQLVLLVSLVMPHRVRVYQDSSTNAPPATPVFGASVKVGSSPTGAFAGHVSDTATWNGSEWSFAASPAVGEVKRITVKDHHLWLAHPGAIVSLDSTVSSNGGYGPKRCTPVANDPPASPSTGSQYQVGSTPTGTFVGHAGEFATWDGASYHYSSSAPVVKLRDDRDRLMTILAEAAVWYLPVRKVATWTLKACGLTDGWFPMNADGSTSTTITPWPRLGALVKDFSYSGRTETLETPITRVDYNHETGETTWATGWSDRDWK